MCSLVELLVGQVLFPETVFRSVRYYLSASFETLTVTARVRGGCITRSIKRIDHILEYHVIYRTIVPVVSDGMFV